MQAVTKAEAAITVAMIDARLDVALAPGWVRARHDSI